MNSLVYSYGDGVDFSNVAFRVHFSDGGILDTSWTLGISFCENGRACWNGRGERTGQRGLSQVEQGDEKKFHGFGEGCGNCLKTEISGCGFEVEKKS